MSAAIAGERGQSARQIPPSGRASILGCEIDRASMAETIALCEALIEEAGCSQQVSINVSKLVQFQRDAALQQFVEQCTLVNADGQAIVWASRLLGDPLPERVAGIDLMYGLLGLSARKGYRIFVLGARQEILERAIARIEELYPQIEIAGFRNGYFDESEDEAVCAAISEARPHILFVAMSSPRKEHWMSRYAQELRIPFTMGVGGSVDIIAGVTRRAPGWMQRSGLEWLYRLSQEPGRLWRRYLYTNSRFAWLLTRELIRGRR